MTKFSLKYLLSFYAFLVFFANIDVSIVRNYEKIGVLNVSSTLKLALSSLKP
jgi:hypothetical protein